LRLELVKRPAGLPRLHRPAAALGGRALIEVSTAMVTTLAIIELLLRRLATA
jgi:hypothetical protein